MSLRLMKSRMSQSGITFRDEIIHDARQLIEWENEHDPSYCPSLYFWIPGESPHKDHQIHLRLYDKKYTVSAGNTQQFQSKITEMLEVGDYVFNEADNTYWICTESFNINDIHYQGKLTQCNWFLKWQRNDGTILEYPVQDLNASQSSAAVSNDTVMTMGKAHHIETIQATEDTIAIQNPQRFYISKTNSIPFIVTQNDTTACNYGKGLCKIVVVQDTVREDKDRADLGICDYHTPTLPDAEISGTPHCKIICNSNAIRVGGIFREYTALFKDSSDQSVMSVQPVWDINCDFTDKLVIVKNNNCIRVSVSDENLIGESFLLTLSDSLNEFIPCTLKIYIEGL